MHLPSAAPSRAPRAARIRLIRRAASLVLPLFGACASPQGVRPGETVVADSAGVRIVSTARPLVAPPAAPLVIDTVPSLSIGEEVGDEAYQLHGVSDATVLADGRIVVANAGASEMRVFDAAGRFLARVGRPGAGPGEFAPFSPARLFQRRGELLASDPEPSRLHAYDSTLSLLGTRRFPVSDDVPRPWLRDVLADGTWLATAYEGGGALGGPPGSVIRATFALALFDAQGAFLRRFGSFEGGARYVHTVGEVTHYPFLPLSASATVLAYGNEILAVRGDRPELELWDADGTLRTVMRWNRERLRSAEVYPRYREQAVADLAGAGERERTLYGAFFAKELPLPEFAAMYDHAVVDAARRIWVHRARLPGEVGPNLWDVLDPSGRWLGAAATPRGVRPFEIGERHLIGLSRDSLGVERVVRHAYRAGP